MSFLVGMGISQNRKKMPDFFTIFFFAEICTYSAAKYFPAVFLRAKRVAAGVLPVDAGGTAS